MAPDGKILATGDRDGTVRLWDPATGKETAKLEGHNYVVFSLAWRPGGEALASASSDHTIRIWRLPKAK